MEHNHFHASGDPLSLFYSALTITTFVAAMMILVEYINIYSRNNWLAALQKNKYGQYITAVFLGLIPGCLGAYSLVTLYTHGIVSIGALVAGFIATSGDEAFLMLAMSPSQSLKVFIWLGIVGFISAIVVDFLFKKVSKKGPEFKSLPIHADQDCQHTSHGSILEHFKHCTLARAALLTAFSLILLGFLTGSLGPDTWNWLRITFVIIISITLFIIATVPDHFLEEHLWQHIIKQHVHKIFLWSFGALLLIAFFDTHIHLHELVHDNRWLILLVAVLVGIIPQSGPHIIFLTMFIQGSLPMSVFLANSIVQDGHGSLPLLAHSRKDFLKVKIINVLFGLFVGGILLLFGY